MSPDTLPTLNVDLSKPQPPSAFKYATGFNRLDHVLPGLNCRIDNMTVHTPFSMRSYMPEPELMLQFRLASPSQVRYPDKQRLKTLAPHFAVITMPANEDKVETFSRQQQDRVITLHCQPSFLIDTLREYNKALPSWLVELLAGRAINFFESFPISQNMRTVASKIMEANPEQDFYRLLLQGQCIELLQLGLQSLFDARQGNVRVAGMTRLDGEKIEAAKEKIDRSFPDLPSLASLAKSMNMSNWKFNRGFKALYDMSASQYIVQLRMTKAQQLLIESQWSITDIGAEAGYNYLTNFSKAFKEHTGISPKDYRATYATRTQA